MNEYFVQRINEFGELAEPFKDLWRSIILRAGWFECEGEPRPLVISIRFSSDAVAKRKPLGRPAVGPFKVAWESVGIERFGDVLDSLRKGFVEIEGRRLALSYKYQGKWTDFSSGHASFERPGIYDWSGRELAEVRFFYSTSATDDAYNPVGDRRLEELWRSAKSPYWDKSDVLREFFEVERGNQQNEVEFALGGQIPLRLSAETQLKDGKLDLGIETVASAKPEAISVGAIVSTFRPSTKRTTLRLYGSWKKSKGKALFRQRFELGSDAARVALLLRYRGKTVERREVLPVVATAGNLGLAAHEAFDRTAAFYRRALAGAGNDAGKDFERSVAWLFSLCGFTAIPYSQSKPFENTAPDLLAVSKRDNLVLGVECTISQPNTGGKLVKLRDRCNELRQALRPPVKVLAVLATALEDGKIAASDRSLAAEDDIMVLPFERLSELHGLAASGQPVSKAVAYLKKLRSQHGKGGLFGPSEDDV